MSVSRMKKLTVLAYNTDTDAVLRTLMRLRCVDLRSVEGLGDGKKPIRFEEDGARVQTDARIQQIKKAIPMLAKYSMRKKSLGRTPHRIDRDAFVAEGRAQIAMDTVEEAIRLQERTNALLAEQTREENLASSLSPWAEYDAPLNETGSAKTETVFVTSAEGILSLETREQLENAGAYLELVCQDGKNSYFVATYCRPHEDAVNRAITQRGCLKVTLPNISMTAREAVDRCEARLREIDTELLKNEERMRELAQELEAVEILCDIEATAAELAKQKRKVALTRNCAVIQGWIPAEKEDSLASALSEFSCACEVNEPEDGEEPPVLLKNNAFAANFEWVIGMYSYPKYGTFDPALIMGIFYFLLFGMMFADVGYGLLLTLGCIAGVKILKPKEGMRRMLSMFAYCGISSMFMGILFGGWFGDLPIAIMDNFIYHESGIAITTAIGKFFSQGLLFNPTNSPVAFLILGLAIGEIHLIAGMAVNMIETCKKGNVLQGICSTVPYWIFFIGVDLMAPTAVVDMIVTDPAGVSDATRVLFVSLMNVGAYLAIAGLISILLFKGFGEKNFVSWLMKGLGGLYSIISYASDLLSYSRILALGLAAGVIAQVINMMTGLGATGFVGFIVMLVVMIVGHGLNLAINLLGTFVHAARLQYIEFFGKFYEDGGKQFTPMLPTEEYSEDI